MNEPKRTMWMDRRTFLLGTLLLALGAALLVPGCKPAEEVVGIVRGTHSEKPLDKIEVTLWRGPVGLGTVVDRCTTAAHGLFGFAGTHGLIDEARSHPGETRYWLHLFDKKRGTSDTIAVSGFRGVFDHRMDDGAQKAPDSAFKVADMHYHVSMRIHNHFATEVQRNSHHGRLDTALVPTDLSWYRSQRKLEILGPCGWHTAPPVKWKRMKRALSEGGADSSAYTALFTKGMVRAREGNNKFTDHNQATKPHIRNGRVRLAYNAISPFENNLNRGFWTQLLGGKIKTGVRPEWSKRIGGSVTDARTVTHWEDFLYEHGMMARQDTMRDGFRCRSLEDGSQLRDDDTTSFIVTAVEGGHFLQDDLFPNEGAVDVAGRTDKYQRALISSWKSMLNDTVTNRLDLYQRIDVNEVLAIKDSLDRSRHMPKSSERAIEEMDLSKRLHAAVDTALIHELRRNIAHVRDTAFWPPVHMVAIAHLGYNGMVGHAPALDDGNSVVNLLARKVYNMRLSTDRTYLEQWRRLYFTVPGVNIYGKEVIHGLTRDIDGRRILVDLKHSDLVTRHYFYDHVMCERIPPICSHCGVTGMSEHYWSPFNNEYELLNDPMVRTYYPFGINLYDEEIVRIHENEGIIGLPLEQRLLGGYIDDPMPWNMHITKDGVYKPAKSGTKTARWEHVDRLFQWLDGYPAVQGRGNIPNTEIADAKGLLDRAKVSVTYTQSADIAHSGLVLVQEDFRSVVPLLQNLFYILDRIMDHEGRATDPAKSMSIARSAWSRVCFGSDLDGLIDPIDLVPTAGEYPLLRKRMEDLIPLFLYLRAWESPPLIDQNGPDHFRRYASYFPPGWSLSDALDALFYGNLARFTEVYTSKSPAPCDP